MRGSPKVIYIDSDLLIAWLLDEETTPSEIRDGVNELIKKVETGSLHLIVSTIHKPECKSIKKFMDALFKRRTRVTPVSVSLRVAERARDYMEQYNLKPHDAIHLATATLYECAYFYAKDAKLLRIKNVDKTAICLPPFAMQPTLITSPHAQTPKQDAEQ